MKDNMFWILAGVAALYFLSKQSAGASSGQTPAPTVSSTPLGPANIFTVTCYDSAGNAYQIGSGPCPPASTVPPGGGSNYNTGNPNAPNQNVLDTIQQMMNY